MKGKHVLITFAFFLGDLCSKAGHRCSYPGQPADGLKNRIAKQISAPRPALPGAFCFVFFLEKDRLSLTSDAEPCSVQLDGLRHGRARKAAAPAALRPGPYWAELHSGGSHQFTCRADVLHFGISWFQNRSKMNLFHTSASPSTTFTVYMRTLQPFAWREAVCLRQLRARQSTFPSLASALQGWAAQAAPPTRSAQAGTASPPSRAKRPRAGPGRARADP